MLGSRLHQLLVFLLPSDICCVLCDAVDTNLAIKTLKYCRRYVILIYKKGHWTTLINTGDSNFSYFDSLATHFHRSHPRLRNFLPLEMSRGLQSTYSDLCGYYIILCAVHLFASSKHSLETFESLFTSDTVLNDMLVSAHTEQLWENLQIC